MRLHAGTVTIWRRVNALLVMMVLIKGNQKCKKSSNLFLKWPKMLLTVPRQGKKLFKCGKIHQVTGKTCWAIINTWGLEPPLITTGQFILPRYLSGDNEIDLISA